MKSYEFKEKKPPTIKQILTVAAVIGLGFALIAAPMALLVILIMKLAQ